MTDESELPPPLPRPLLPGGTGPQAGERAVPIGRHGRPRGEIEAIQRSRIVHAFVVEVGRYGYEGARVAAICIAAGVSTKEFYSSFRGKEDCFLAAFDQGADVVCGVMKTAFDESRGSWEHRLRVALTAMLELLAANPAFTRLSVIEAYKVSDVSAEHVNAVIARCRSVLGGSRPPRRSLGDVPNEALISSLVGGALRPMIDYVEGGRVEQLPSLAATMTYSIAVPIVGEERALRELEPPS